MNEESIFAAALQKKSPQEREAFLNETCQGNAGLRAQVEELLSASAAAGSFFEHPPAGLDATIDAVGTSHDTVKSANWSGSLAFLQPCDTPGRIGRLDVYEIIEVVGSGGMGVVLRAFDTKLSRVVAVKVMAPELSVNPTAVKRFLREAKAAAAVVHDHVVTIHNVEESRQPPFLVMQFIDGQTLQQKIEREGALDLKEILRIGCQTAAGLAAAHKHGVIHRDVKPANILLENGVERVKITDFGLARAADDIEITQTGLIAGTPQYMSPEQARGEPMDARSDLFSLGSVLYTMCTGRPAFRAETTMGVLRRVCDDEPRPIHEVNAEIPAWLEAIVHKLLAKNPGDRFQTAAEVAELLGQCLAHVQNPGQVPLPAIGFSPVTSPVANVPAAVQRRPLLVPVLLILTPFLLIPLVMAVTLTIGLAPSLFLGLTVVASGAAMLTGLVLLIVRLATRQSGERLPPHEPWGHPQKLPAAATPKPHGLLTPVLFMLAPLLLIPVVLAATLLSGTPQRLLFGLAIVLSGVATLSGLVLFVVRLAKARDPAERLPPHVTPRHPQKSPPPRPRSSFAVVVIVVCALLLVLPLVAMCLLLGWYYSASYSRETANSFGPPQTGVMDPTESMRLMFPQDGTLRLEVTDPALSVRIDKKLLATRPGSNAFQIHPGRHQFEVLRGEAVVQSESLEIPIGPCIVNKTIGRSVSDASQSPTEADAESGWTPLFNGNDLTGWKTHPSQPGNWRVENGILIGSGSRSHLFSERGDFRDFHLRAEVKVSDPGDSGIYFRSEFGLSFSGINPKGYEAQIGQANDGHRTGSLYGFAKVTENLVQPDTWFTMDVIARGNHITTVVNGQTAAEFVDAKETYKTGHFALQTEFPRTVVQFRKIEIKELSPDQPTAGDAPFALLAGDIGSAQKFNTLSQAVAAAKSGNIIEVRGNGPFVVPSIRISGKALAIRAAAGFRPVIRLEDADAQTDAPLLWTNAALVLEGLDFERITEKGVWMPGMPPYITVWSVSAPLYVANCQFRQKGGMACIYADKGSAVCDIRNCAFLTPDSALWWWCASGSRLNIENCVHNGFHSLVTTYRGPLPGVSVKLKGNTFVANEPLLFCLVALGPGETSGSGADGLSWDVSENVLGSLGSILEFNQTAEFLANNRELQPDGAKDLMRRLLRWHDRRNAYAAESYGVLTQANRNERTTAFQTLNDWSGFWERSEARSFGKSATEAEDFFARLRLGAERVALDEFRLRPNDAGYRQGDKERDLGADIDLVGPGEAYQRWQRTSEFEQWRLNTAGVAGGSSASAVPHEAEFVQLFNGKDLTGWNKKPDQPGGWVVEDGILIGRGRPASGPRSGDPVPHLFSERGDYQNFHLRAEMMVNQPADGGIYFRAPPELTQIDPTTRRRYPGGYEIHTLKDQQGFAFTPLTNVKADEWVALEVIAEGNRVIVKVNGETTADVKNDAFDRGHFVLQAWSPDAVVKFRKFEIKELPRTPHAARWVPLFNGTDLAGWKTHPDQPGDWKVENGLLVGSGRVSHLFTERGDYENFHLRFEAKVNAGGDSGVLFRAPFGIRPGWNGPLGYEAQIAAKTGTVLKGQDVFGDPAGIKPGTWFQGEVIAADYRIVVRIDGQTTANFEDPERSFAKGHLALQVWNPQTVVQFRKIEIKELPAGATGGSSASAAVPAATGPANDVKEPTAFVWGPVRDGWQIGFGWKNGKLHYAPGEPVEFELKVRNATDAEKTIDIGQPDAWDVWYSGGSELSLRILGREKEKVTLAPREERVIAVANPNARGEPLTLFPGDEKLIAAAKPQIKTDGLAKGFYRVQLTTTISEKQILSAPNFGFYFDGPEPPAADPVGASSREPLKHRDHADVAWGQPLMGLSLGVGPATDEQERKEGGVAFYVWNTAAVAVDVQYLAHHPLDWQLATRDGKGNEYRSAATPTGPKELTRAHLEPG